MMHTTETLHALLRQMDRALQNRARLEKLSLTQAQTLLETVQQFVAACEQLPDTTEARFLQAAGCRLSSDLSEQVLTRVLDLQAERETSINQLCKALQQEMKDRYLAQTLVQQVQSARQNLHLTGERVGLGVVL